MSSKAEKDRGKQIEDKCQSLLTEMLRDEDNKYCVDCDAKGPRWASWNLGIFLCIRCAGIHRNLGVHISKVKSVNLDTWTPEQVVSLQQMGNSRARAVYEANIPDNFRRPQLDSALEAFIRAKYEHKKYIAKEWVPTPIPNVKQNWDKELDEEAERQKKRKKETKTSQQQQSRGNKTELATATPQMLPKPKSSTSPRPLRSSPGITATAIEAKRPQHSTAAMDLFFGDTGPYQSTRPVSAAAIFRSQKRTNFLIPVRYNHGDNPVPSTASSGQNSASSNSEDIFSSFLSAPPAPAAISVTAPAAALPATIDDGGRGRSAEEESFFNQPAPTSQEKRQLTKDSILALYGAGQQQQQAQQAPASANNMFGVPGGVYTQPPGGFPPQQPTSNMGFGMTNGMMGAPQPTGMPNGMLGGQHTGMPNGMMGSQPANNMFGIGVAQQQQGINSSLGMASNPFFNMGANPMANPMGNPMGNIVQGFPQMSQLPQQMGRMNLGPQTKQPGQMFQGQPIRMQMPQQANVNTFPTSNNPGHTLATNLWQ